MKANDRVWVLVRSTQYIHHIATFTYFTSEKAALDYIKKHDKLKGTIAQPLDLWGAER